MKVYIKYFFVFILIVLITDSCKKIENEPISNDPTVPQQVTNISVINQAGKSIITYSLPNDPNLFYVKAVYKASSGIPLEAKSTYFGDSLTLPGFADTLEHEVKLYTVSRSNVMSEPIIVMVKPKEAPIWLVYKSIELNTAFGGYNLTAINKEKADISLLTFKRNIFNEYEVDNNASVFTNTDSILAKIRGLDTLTYTYGFVVQDKYGNRTDTLFKTFKPFYEVEIPRDKFRDATMPGDAAQWGSVSAMWDNWYGWVASFVNEGASPPGPSLVTFDMGTLAKVSRIKIFPYSEWGGDPNGNYYYFTTMKRFELYGSAKPTPSGELDSSWQLLGSYTVVKPTNSPYGQDNDQDRAVAHAGFNWEVDLSVSKVRYIRIRCLENFSGTYAQSVAEIFAYGDPR